MNARTYIFAALLLVTTRVAGSESELRVAPSEHGTVSTSEVAASAVSNRREIQRVIETNPQVARLGLNVDAISTRRVFAVEGLRGEAVTASNVAGLADAGFAFVEISGPVQRTAAPTILTADNASAPTFKLGYKITALSRADSPLQLDVWAQDGTGLSVDGPTKYSGEFNVALTDANQPDLRAGLESPISIAVSARGASSIDPTPLQIQNLAQWYGVKISVPAPEGSAYPVEVSVNPTVPRARADMAIIRPTVELSATPKSIVNYGIQQAMINVNARGMRNPKGFRVRLDSSEGSLRTGSIILAEDGHGDVGLRSNRADATTITVLNDEVNAIPLDIRFRAPWVFLGFAIGGGLIGALLRGKGRQRWPAALGIGVLSGLVMTLLYSVGVDWLSLLLAERWDIAWSGEALVFVLGVVGALAGVSIAIPALRTD